MSSVRTLSTQQVMSVAKERLLQISSKSQHFDLSTVQNFFNSTKFDLSGGSAEETKDAELAVLLLAAAHKFQNKEFTEARKFLNLCNFFSSNARNPVQRTVYYFSKALQEKLCQEIGNAKEITEEKILHPQETSICLIPSLISTYLKLPYQVIQFAGIQIVLDHIKEESATKVHFIDHSIKIGEHCAVLIQALAENHQQKYPFQSLKITAVGNTNSKLQMEEIGKRLESFAQNLNLPFLFKTVLVSDIKDLKQEMFELNQKDDDEAVVIYSRTILRNIITEPKNLEFLIKFFKTTKPCIWVVHEIEANHNLPVFIDRFEEALLYYYSAHFDCLEACLDRNDRNRVVWETCVGQEIRDLIFDDERRNFRDMKIDQWRDFFSRHEMVEIEISGSALSQAEMALNKIDSAGNLFSKLDRNGKCIISSWKGTSTFSLSAWKFQKDQSRKKKSLSNNDHKKGYYRVSSSKGKRIKYE